MSERLSRWFTLDELVVTTHTQFAAQQLEHGKRCRLALVALCTTILDPIRDQVGRPVAVNSGVRCPQIRDLIPGASPTSQHNLGQAADIVVPGYTEAQLRDLWRWIGWRSGLAYGQVILEDKRPADPTSGAWIHVSLGAPWRSASRCGQRLTWSPTEGYRTHTLEPT
jgi:zinc D-Ala-D-Ala carboxypeptidase